MNRRSEAGIAAKVWLAFEFTALFLFLPVAFYLEWISLPKIPSLLLMTLFCLTVLLRDPGFTRKQLWNFKALSGYWKALLVRIALVAPLILTFTLLLQPQQLFSFLKRAPLIWLMVMFLYPWLSAYPQELIFRAFFFQRYGRLIRDRRVLIGLNAVCFGLLHLMYDNVVAVVFGLFGGLLFALTYHRTRSVAVTALEHAVYGCCVFTAGLGHYFYEGF